MTQYVINIGTIPNDGTGDPLRTAFNEVNLNFDQVFAAGPVLSNIQIANNTILTTNTNGNLVLAPNGIGVVQSNVHLVPNTSNIRNLGAADRRWSTLYVQYANVSGGLVVADFTATGNVTVGGNLSVTGNVINIGNIVTDSKTIQLANTAGTANAADGSGITVGANDAIATMLYSSADNAWNFNIGLQTPNIVVNNISSDDSTFVTIQDGLDVQGDITAETVSVTGNVTANYFIGNGSQLTGVSNYANANAVAYGQSGWAGNIVPAASNTYSIGNSSLWWSNIWVAGNTMYIGGVPIGMSAGNVLTVDGNAVLQNNSNSTISTTGNITANYFFGNGSQLTGLSTNSISNGTSNVDIPVANGNVTINTNGTYAWTFDDTGNLNLPSGSLNFNGGHIYQRIDDDLRIVVQDVENDGYNLDLIVNNGTDDNTLLRVQNDEVRIRTNITPGPSYDWSFSDTGQFNVAGPIMGNYGGDMPIYILNNVGDGIGNVELIVRDYGSDAVLSNVKVGRSNVQIGVDTGGSVWSFGTGNTLTLPNGGEIDSSNNNIEFRSPNNINFEATSDLNIYTDDGNSQWTFGSGNTLTLPGGTAVIDSSDDNIELRSNNNINMEAFSVVNVYTDSGNFQYQFGDDGGFYVPNNGALVGVTANNNGYINWVGNSSGDGNGFTTMQLVPDGTVDSQILVLDPTAPGHIHLRAPGIGGNIEQPAANIYLGAEDTNFEITAQYGNAAEARIHSAGNTWTFANNGNLNLPFQGNIVGLTANNAGYLQWLGNSSGDGAGYTTLQLVPDDTLTGGDQYLIVDPTAPGHIHIRAGGTQDNSAAELIIGGENSHFKVGSGANATVYVNANAHIWWYNQDGTVQLPPSDYGYAQFYTGGSANLYLGSSSYPINIVGTDGTVLIPGNATANGTVSGDVGFFNDVIVNNAGTNSLLYTNSNREIYDTGFAYDSGNDLISGSGAISTTGNISAGYLFGNASQVTGLPAGYANSDVATFLAAFGSNNISTTGNVTANNISGNIQITGNIQGTTPNVTIIAGSYSWTFDNTGNLQGNISFTGGNITINNAPGGEEGAEIKWALPAPANTVLNTSVIQDVYQNGMRFFESGGNSRGLYMDLGNVPNGASTAVGYRDIPQISFTGNTTTVANAAGRHYYSTESTDYILTIANNTSVGWSLGTAITIVNRGTGNMTIAQGTGVSLYLAGNSTAGNRTVTTYGMATLLNVAANVWMINGTGVS